MLRHEMVQNIATEIVCFKHPFLAWDLAQDLADVILTRIEKDGMVPPLSDELNQINSKYYGWDKENET